MLIWGKIDFKAKVISREKESLFNDKNNNLPTGDNNLKSGCT